MKKLFTLLMVLVLGFVLYACGGEDDPIDPNGPTQTIALSYADWGDPEFNQRMIDAFEEEYPHIDVTLRTDIEGSGEAFTGNLVTAAQAGLLPDVFATDNVPTVINAGLTLDVAE